MIRRALWALPLVLLLCAPAFAQVRRVPETDGVPYTRQITTSSPLVGGGNLLADLTLSCPGCVQLSPAGAQTGSINITGGLTFGTSILPSGAGLNIGGSVSSLLGFVGTNVVLQQVQSPAFSATPSFNCQNGETIVFTLTANVTSWTINNSQGFAETCTLILKQDATGNRTWPAAAPSNLTYAGGAFTITATANKTDVLRWCWDNPATKWRECGRSQNQ